jgi:hypothetical protein
MKYNRKNITLNITLIGIVLIAGIVLVAGIITVYEFTTPSKPITTSITENCMTFTSLQQVLESYILVQIKLNNYTITLFSNQTSIWCLSK